MKRAVAGSERVALKQRRWPGRGTGRRSPPRPDYWRLAATLCRCSYTRNS